jgi:hypothetical protein
MFLSVRYLHHVSCTNHPKNFNVAYANTISKHFEFLERHRRILADDNILSSADGRSRWSVAARLAGSLRPGYHRANTGSLHVEFELNKMTVGTFLFKCYAFPCQSSFHKLKVPLGSQPVTTTSILSFGLTSDTEIGLLLTVNKHIYLCFHFMLSTQIIGVFLCSYAGPLYSLK